MSSPLSFIHVDQSKVIETTSTSLCTTIVSIRNTHISITNYAVDKVIPTYKARPCPTRSTAGVLSSVHLFFNGFCTSIDSSTARTVLMISPTIFLRICFHSIGKLDLQDMRRDDRVVDTDSLAQPSFERTGSLYQDRNSSGWTVVLRRTNNE
jgi:hypothetical protein